MECWSGVWPYLCVIVSWSAHCAGWLVLHVYCASQLNSVCPLCKLISYYICVVQVDFVLYVCCASYYCVWTVQADFVHCTCVHFFHWLNAAGGLFMLHDCASWLYTTCAQCKSATYTAGALILTSYAVCALCKFILTSCCMIVYLCCFLVHTGCVHLCSRGV